MNNNSRTKKSIINSIYASGSQIITTIMNFVVRTIFIKTLTAEYLGLNGLFSNIITMLSLADLGIGIAIPYTLYKPLSEKNEEKINILMKLYSKMYNVIGVIILLLGLMFTPFIKYIIKDIPNISNINLIYIMFIINASVSYFFIYKKMLIDADQKSYIPKKIILNMTVIKSILEIIILLTTKNYIIYLLISIMITICQNLWISKKCDSLYPYIKNKTNKNVEKSDIDELKKNVTSLVIYRIGIVALNGTDNIIISKFIGVVVVGIYSNYLLIINAVTNVLSQIFDAITASVGNLVVTTNDEKSENVFYKLQFFCFWLYTFFATCIIVLVNHFIKLWVGQEYLLSNITAFVIGVNLYIYGMQSVVTSYRNAYGLFQQGKYRPIIMTIVNIILSIILAQKLNIFGVILATVISRLFVTGIYDPIVVYKYGFKKSPKKYFIQYIKYFLIFVIISTILLFATVNLDITNYIYWISLGIVVALVVNAVIILLYSRNENFLFFLNKFSELLKNRRKKSNG